jgi:hypothetical protein
VYQWSDKRTAATSPTPVPSTALTGEPFTALLSSFPLSSFPLSVPFPSLSLSLPLSLSL